MVVLAFLAAMAQSTAAPAPFTLNLICEGEGTQAKPTSSFGTFYASNGRWANGSVTSMRREGFQDAVRIEIAGDGGRIRIPQFMLPAIRGGHEGWMNLKKVAVRDDEIDAQATINFANTAKIRIDRITGAMSLGVLRGNFSGHCQPYDPAKVERA